MDIFHLALHAEVGQHILEHLRLLTHGRVAAIGYRPRGRRTLQHAVRWPLVGRLAACIRGRLRLIEQLDRRSGFATLWGKPLGDGPALVVGAAVEGDVARWLFRLERHGEHSVLWLTHKHRLDLGRCIVGGRRQQRLATRRSEISQPAPARHEGPAGAPQTDTRTALPHLVQIALRQAEATGQHEKAGREIEETRGGPGPIWIDRQEQTTEHLETEIAENATVVVVQRPG